MSPAAFSSGIAGRTEGIEIGVGDGLGASKLGAIGGGTGEAIGRVIDFVPGGGGGEVRSKSLRGDAISAMRSNRSREWRWGGRRLGE
jgi:hypothetical protein